MTIQELFISNLKAYRKRKNLSQSNLAALCDSSQNYIAEIENAKRFPSPSMIECIAAALEIESFRLFSNDPIDYHAEIPKLTMFQKYEIIEKIHSAAAKIIENY